MTPDLFFSVKSDLESLTRCLRPFSLLLIYQLSCPTGICKAPALSHCVKNIDLLTRTYVFGLI